METQDNPGKNLAVSGAYELLDFGDGRKLERFETHILDRPAPAAIGARRLPAQRWDECHARFVRTAREEGSWHAESTFGSPWILPCGSFHLQLRPTPFGHIGVFPEQADNWCSIAKQANRRAVAPRVLNLFAYTGGSTLAAAAAGAEVVHVDAARNVVQWARENAQLSGLDQAPIRWITEDAARFVEREVKRGNRYDAIILDPPSYGKGPRGETWKLSTDLLPLLRNCRRLLSDEPAFVLLSCHSTGWGAAELAALLQQTFDGRCSMNVQTRSMTLSTADARRLLSGLTACWSP